MFNKRYLIFPIDIVFMTISYFLAHIVRYESLEFLIDPERFMISMLIVVGSRSAIFLFSDIYRSFWAYASIHDLIEIIKTTLWSSFVSTTALVFYNRFSQHSRMVPILDTLILLSLLCLRSFSWRIIRDEYLSPSISEAKPTLIIGAGKSGLMLSTEIRRQPELKLRTIGFLDDDPSTWGAHIQGIPVLGQIEQLEYFLVKLKKS